MDLYIATRSDAPHLLKIGRSSNANSRCRQLQNGHCFRIHVIAMFRGVGACEKPIHRALRDYRVGDSEWFCVDMLTAVEAIQKAEPQKRQAIVPQPGEDRVEEQAEGQDAEIHAIPTPKQRVRINVA